MALKMLFWKGGISSLRVCVSDGGFELFYS